MKNRSIPFFILAIIITLSGCNNPEASFLCDCGDCEIGDVVQFTSTSVNAETFDWDFGDGSTSTEENPVHIYTAMGTYNVQLTVSNNNGSDMAGESVIIKGFSGLRIDTVVYSPGLEGNLLGDSPNRDVTIYLPPEYESSGKDYPVVYLLHGYEGDNELWFGNGYVPIDLEPIMNTLINNSTIEPMILVSPDSKNYFDGSWYINSSSSGNWEDFIVQDVVQFMDENFRTLANADSRGIAGHSMGGYGTVYIAIRNPDVFGAAYGLSSSFLNFGALAFNNIPGPVWEEIFGADNLSDYASLSRDARLTLSIAVAMVPNPSHPPFYCDYLFNEEEFLDSVWEKYMAHDPYSYITTYNDKVLQLNAFKINCGDQDGNTDANVQFAEKLATIGIENAFESYEGDHTNKIKERMKLKVIPFMSEHLVHDTK